MVKTGYLPGKSHPCKALHIPHELTFLVLGLRFYTEDLDKVSDTVNIFLFNNLSLELGFEASMVVKQWYNGLDRNIITTYSYTYALLQR